MRSSVFINNFQKGTSQSPSLGIGAIVGFDAYSKQGAVILGKRINSTTQLGVGEYPTYMALSGNFGNFFGTRLWVQTGANTYYWCDNYSSSSPTFNLLTLATPAAGNGNGLVVFQDGGTQYVFAFTDTTISYTQADATSPTSFTQWKTGLNGLVTSPIANNHFPYLFPNNHGVYFANSNKVGFFGSVYPVGATAPTAFNPGGSINTNYLYNDSILTLPSNYAVNALDFLPPSSLAIGANNVQSGQEADIFTWDTISANKFSAPIKVFSGVNQNGMQGVKQLVNRQNVLYAVVGGNHAIYSTNGGTVNVISDMSLYSNVRDGLAGSNGKEYPVPVYFNSFPQAIAVSGNRILTGVSTSSNSSYYPAVDSGAFPTGIWSIYFNNDGSTLQQMDMSIPFLGNLSVGSLSSWSQSGDFAGITSILPLPNGQTAVGWVDRFAGVTFGNISVFDNLAYIQDRTLTSLESELFEIGTALVPSTPEKIEVNLIKSLLSDQSVEISYRTATDQNWTVIQTFNGTADGSRNYYSIQQHPIGATQYVQLRVRANTGATNPNDTVELRSIAIS